MHCESVTVQLQTPEAPPPRFSVQFQDGEGGSRGEARCGGAAAAPRQDAYACGDSPGEGGEVQACVISSD